jgi:broad specificity phosphatase PhoE
MNEIPQTSFYFARHGETDWNLAHKAMGSQDIHLNEHGLAQAFHTAKILQNKSIKTVVTSPLIRARKSGDIIASYINAAMIEITSLKEACFGEQEGQESKNDAWFNAWCAGGEMRGGEKYSDFVLRVKKGIIEALNQKGPVLIVSHGGVYWAIQEILGLSRMNINNLDIVFHSPPQDSGDHWRSDLFQQ